MRAYYHVEKKRAGWSTTLYFWSIEYYFSPYNPINKQSFTLENKKLYYISPLEREGYACDDLEIENYAMRYPLIGQNFAHRKKEIKFLSKLVWREILQIYHIFLYWIWILKI